MPRNVEPPAVLAYRQSEAARLLGVSRQVVSRLIRDGELEGVRPPGGRSVLVPAESLSALWDRLRQEAQDERETAAR